MLQPFIHPLKPHLMSRIHKNIRFITAGSILLMAVAAGFSYGYVHTSLFIAGDAKTTLYLLNIQGDLFTAGLLGWCLILLLDLIVSWGVFAMYRKQNPVVAQLTAVLRLLYTLIFAFAIAALFEIPALTAAQDAEAVHAAFEKFNQLWSQALIVFGLHLLSLAIPVWSSSRFSRVVSVLLFLAGLAYLFVHSMKQFDVLSGLAGTIEQVSTPVMALGELVFAVFLFFRAKARDGYSAGCG